MDGAVSSFHDEAVFLGIGSNMGDRHQRMMTAIQFLEFHSCIRLLQISDIIETEPWGGVPQPCFLNAIARVSTTLSPLDLLGELQQFEHLQGRTRDGARWGPRVVDLDILLFGKRILMTDILEIPHPRMLQRVFVLRQLVEMDSTLTDPLHGQRYSVYLNRLEQSDMRFSQ